MNPHTIDVLSESLADAGVVAAKKMFGEYGNYCDGIFIGVVCDDIFHLKPTKPGLAFAPEIELAPAYPGAKPSMVVPADRWDKYDWIIPLVKTTVAPLPPARKRK